VRARALSRLGRPAEAEQALASAGRPGLLVRRAELLARLGHGDEAEALLTEAAAAGAVLPAVALRAWWRLEAGDEAGAAALAFDESRPEADRAAVALAIAERFESAGRAEDGIAWLARAHAALPRDPEVLAALALGELSRGLERPEAVALRGPVVRQAAAHPASTALSLAAAYYSLLGGDVDVARAAAATALAARPLDADARRLAAFVNIREKRYGLAREQVRCVLALRPRDPAARGLVNALEVMEAQARLDRGEEAIVPGRLLDPNRRGQVPRAALLASARAGLSRGDLAAAADAFSRLGLAKDAEFLVALGDLEDALAEGRPGDALAAARSMVEARPRSPMAQLRLGLLALATGGEEEGLAALGRAVELAPWWEAARIRHCRALADRGRSAEAARSLEERLASHPSDALALALLAELRLAGGDPTAAAAFAERALSIGGADALARETLIRLAERDGGAAAALGLAREWVSAGAPTADLLALAGHAALAAGERAEAERRFRAALDLDRDHLEANAGMAEVAAANLKPTVALEHALRARKRAPLDPGLGVLVAGLREVKGDRAGAIRAYEEVLRIRPDHPLAALNLAWLLAADGSDRERAVALAESAVEGMPGAPEALDTLGRALLGAGRAEEAAKRLGEALEAGAGFDTKVRLARAFDAAGDAAEALRVYREVVAGREAFSGRPEIVARIAELEAGEK
jgi:tetratricopeptide (TPR) repeat protein